MNSIFTIIFLALSTYGIIISIKHYFDASDRFEDYLILVAMICMFLEFLIEAYILATGNLRTNLVVVMHGLEFLAYWYMFQFIVKKYPFRNKRNERFLAVSLTIIEILVISSLSMFYGMIGYPPMDPSLPLTLRCQMTTIPGFDFWIEGAQLLTVLASLIVLLIIRKSSILTWSLSVVLLDEILHYLNMIFFGNTDVWLFGIESTISVTAMTLIVISIKSYYDHRLMFKSISKE